MLPICYKVGCFAWGDESCGKCNPHVRWDLEVVRNTMTRITVKVVVFLGTKIRTDIRIWAYSAHSCCLQVEQLKLFCTALKYKKIRINRFRT